MTRFKDLVDSRGVSRSRLSKETGLSAGTLKKYFDGSASIENMTVRSAQKLAEYLHMGLEDFIDAASEKRRINMTKFESYLLNNGISNEALAEKAGLDLGALKRILYGDTAVNDLDRDEIEKISKALDLSEKEFLRKFTESIDKVEFEPGWVDLPQGISVYVDDDMMIRRGLCGSGNGQHAVYFYHMTGDGGSERISEVSVDDLRKGVRKMEISFLG